VTIAHNVELSEAKPPMSHATAQGSYAHALTDEVDAVLRHAVLAGMRASAVRGATAEQISTLLQRQQVSAIPLAVRRIWELIGDEPGPFWRDSVCAVAGLDTATKESACGALASGRHDLTDPDGILVLLAHGGYQFEVIDGAQLHLPNPPVWLVCEGGEPLDRRWNSVTSWFRSGGRGVERAKLRFDEHTRRGGRDLRAEQHFEATQSP
jgi:hypothetical protein